MHVYIYHIYMVLVEIRKYRQVDIGTLFPTTQNQIVTKTDVGDVASLTLLCPFVILGHGGLGWWSGL